VIAQENIRQPAASQSIGPVAKYWMWVLF